MPLSIDEIVKLIDLELQKHAQSEASSVKETREARFKFVKNFLNTHGFPRTMRERFELALHPYYFQEVNYDDLDPYTISGNLGHLKNVYEIDLAIQTEGFIRETISEADFDNYWRRLSGVIKWRQGRVRFRDRFLLFFSKIRR